jgi:hypothetical protein
VPGIPPLVAFLTKTHSGYCQHFAGAMALMLRYLGIPARVAAGFTSGKYHDGTWTVTDRDAHTWVEVWFRGWGWLPFDPTPGRGRLAASYTASSSSFDASAAAAILGGGAIHDLLESRARSGPLPGGGARGERARSVPLPSGGHSREALILGTVALALGMLAAGLYLLKIVGRRLRYLTRDPRRVGAACRRELVDFLADQRMEIGRSATLGEIARAMKEEFGVAADTFVQTAGAARFGAPAATVASASLARRELTLVKRALRGRLSRMERFVGALSPRSLRNA